MHEALKARLESCRTLPVMPAVAMEVLRLCQQASFSMSDVARAIGSDPKLSGKVLRLVNSPLFGLRHEVTTVSHALVLLGVNAVRTIALAFSLVDSMRPLARASFDHRATWRRAIFAAAAARELARSEDIPNAEEAFLAGLLQDVGMLVLGQAVPETYGRLVVEAQMVHDRVVAREVAELGCDHAEVGRWLMTQWDLPEVVRTAVGGSHDPARWQRGQEPSVVAMTRVVAASGAVAELWLDPDLGNAARRGAERLRAVLGYDHERLSPVLERTAQAIVHLAAMFDLPGAGEVEISARLGEMRRVLPMAFGVPAARTPVVEETARRDPLTGLASRLRFDEYLDEQFAFAMRVGKPLSVIMADIDDFEMVVQTFGREAGDRAVAAVGAVLGHRLRYRDLAARYANARFALILTDTHGAGAAVVAERVRKKVEDAFHDIGLADPVRLTLSLGCATVDEVLAFPAGAELVAAAERTLVEAQGAGRNRVMSFTPPRRGGPP